MLEAAEMVEHGRTAEAYAIVDEFTEKAQDTPLGRKRKRQVPDYPTLSPVVDVESGAVIETRGWQYVVRERPPRRSDIFTQSPAPVLFAERSARKPMKGGAVEGHARLLDGGHLVDDVGPIMENHRVLVVAKGFELPESTEKTSGFRKLLEAKDSFIRGKIKARGLQSQ